MKQKIFTNGSKGDNRKILIKIFDNTIWFYFYEQYLQHEQWVSEDWQRQRDEGAEPLNEQEKYNPEFYWIDMQDWDKSKTENLNRGDNWHNHMNEKNWFTKEMEKFIDDNTPF